MKRASHSRLGFITALATMMGMGSSDQKTNDSKEFKREPSHAQDEIILHKFLDSPIFEPKRSIVIKNKRRKIHNKRVKAK